MAYEDDPVSPHCRTHLMRSGITHWPGIFTRSGLVRWQFWLYQAALLVLVTAIALVNILVILLGTVLWADLIWVYIVNVGQIIFHKTKILE